LGRYVELRMEDCYNICSNECKYIKEKHGGCCHARGNEFLMGPIDDDLEFLNRLKENGYDFEYEDVFIDLEEYTNRVNEPKAYIAKPENFPALNYRLDKENQPCIFYNTEEKKCNVYEIRPNTCRNYLCLQIRHRFNIYE